jgi:hypothetical protein
MATVPNVPFHAFCSVWAYRFLPASAYTDCNWHVDESAVGTSRPIAKMLHILICMHEGRNGIASRLPKAKAGAVVNISFNEIYPLLSK